MSSFKNNNENGGKKEFLKPFALLLESQTPNEILERTLQIGFAETIILHACEHDLIDAAKRLIVLRVVNQEHIIHHLTLVPLNTPLNSEPLLLCTDRRYSQDVLDMLTLAVNKKITMEVNEKYRGMSTEVGWCSELHGTIAIYDIHSGKVNDYSYYLVSSFFPGHKRMDKSEFSVKTK